MKVFALLIWVTLAAGQRNLEDKGGKNTSRVWGYVFLLVCILLVEPVARNDATA